MKRIEYYMPVECMRGNLSGRQSIEYDAQGAKGYDVPVGTIATAVNYSPRIIAKRFGRDGLKFFQVRTKTSVHKTLRMQRNLAVMGGAGAMFGALLNQKQSSIYTDCVNAWKHHGKNQTFRQFVFSTFYDGLANDRGVIYVGDDTTQYYAEVENPWACNNEGNVPVSQIAFAKFESQLTP